LYARNQPGIALDTCFLQCPPVSGVDRANVGDVLSKGDQANTPMPVLKQVLGGLALYDFSSLRPVV
jgi:hypothetical protein